MNISPIDFNYIDGLNNYPIQDYIDSNISNLNNNLIIYVNSNITNNINSTYVKITNVSNLSDVIYYNTASNLIIANNYPFGDILFKTSYSYPNDSTKYGTMVDYTGKLLIYHNYNILQPTFMEGYYDVEGEILALKADGINTDVQLTGLEAATVSLQSQINSTVAAVNIVEGELNTLIGTIYNAETFESFKFLNETTDYAQYATRYEDTILNISTRANGLYQSSLQNGLLFSAGVGIAGAVLSSGAAYFYYEKASNALMSNINFTDTQKSNVYAQNLISEITTYSNFYKSTCNMAINQGFISSNIQNQQLIPKLKINEITLNNKTVNKFSLDALEDWIRTPNGIYYDITNGNLGISATPTLTDFLIVGGKTTIQGELIATGRIKENSQYLSNIYASSNYLSNVSNVIIRDSSNFTLGTSNILRGLINTNLGSSSNYASNISNIINANFLKLSGGVMSGQITGVTTLNGTTGIFGQITTTNNTNVGAPTNGVYGGNGDKIILWAGAVGSLPYSLGINGSTLWYSVPIGASHKFYCGGGNPKMTILSNGNIGIGTETPGELLYLYASAGNNAIQSIDSSAGTGLSILRLIAGNATTNRGTFLDFYNNFASTSVPRWRIVNNVDYDTKNDLRIVNASSTATLTILQNGNIGIGINDPGTYKLNVIGIVKMSSFDVYNPDGSVSHFQFGSSGANYIRGRLIMDRAADTASILANVAIGTTPQTEKLYVNGNTTINGVLKLKNSDWHTSIDGVNRLYFALNEITYYCCGGNSQLGHMFMNNLFGSIMNLYNNNDVMINRDLRVNRYITTKCCDSFGEDFTFVVNWNGTTSSGWFVPLNRFWYSGHTCLNVSILPLNAGGLQNICWFGRVYLSHSAGGGTGVPPATNGGVIQISTDFRNPASSSPSNYYVQVGERWDGSGNNALFIQVNNPVYAGVVRVKIRG